MLYLFIFSQSDIIATFSWLKTFTGWMISLNINMLKINRKVDLFFSYMKQHTDQIIDSIFNLVVFFFTWMCKRKPEIIRRILLKKSRNIMNNVAELYRSQRHKNLMCYNTYCRKSLFVCRTSGQNIFCDFDINENAVIWHTILYIGSLQLYCALISNCIFINFDDKTVYVSFWQDHFPKEMMRP